MLYYGLLGGVGIMRGGELLLYAWLVSVRASRVLVLSLILISWISTVHQNLLLNDYNHCVSENKWMS